MSDLHKKSEELDGLSICDSHDNDPHALLEILHAYQGANGYLTDSALRTIAHALNISRAEIHGVVSFYHDFRRQAPANHSLKICRAEACQAVGCEELAAHAESRFETRTGSQSIDGQIDLQAVYCLGNCALGPSVMIDGELFGRVTPERLEQLTAARFGTKNGANE